MWLSLIHSRLFTSSRVYLELKFGLLAQMVERCTGIAEDMGSNPVQAWIFYEWMHYIKFLNSYGSQKGNCLLISLFF